MARARVSAAMDVLSLEEILDRFSHTGESYAGKRIFSCCRGLFTEVLDVTAEDFDRSYALYQEYPHVSPRDLLHAAVALNHRVGNIFSVDGTRFEDIRGISPVQLKHLIRTLKLQRTYTYERQSIS